MPRQLAEHLIDELWEVGLLLALADDAGPEVRAACRVLDGLIGQLRSADDGTSAALVRGVRKATDNLTALAAVRCSDRHLIDAAHAAHRALHTLDRGQ